MIERKNKNSIITAVSLLVVILSLLTAVKFLSELVDEHYETLKTVCLDAGHGADDAGAVASDGREEKNDNLRLTLKVRDRLEKMGVKVILTRDSDSDITLKERCKLANKNRCDLFVSLHRNSSASGTGFEAWIAKEPKADEKEIAERLVKSLSDISGLPNRGVKLGYRSSDGNNYYVNSNTNMPSILLEVGFVTNEEDNKSFDEHIDDNADAIAKIISESLSQTE